MIRRPPTALVRHIVAKDLRLMRWVLGVWIAVSIASAIGRVLTPQLVAADERWTVLVPLWLLPISAAYGLLIVLFVANHIQAERLVGTTAFWLTRPIPRDALMGSKALGLFLFLMLPTLAIEGILMAAFQVPATALVAALLQQAWTMTIVLLILAFGATLTPTATRLLFLIVGAFVAFYAAILILAVISTMAGTPNQHRLGPLPDKPADVSPIIAGFTMFAIGALVAIRYHYKSRRHARASALFLASAALGAIVVGYWPGLPLFGAAPTLAQEPWARDASISRPRLGTRERVIGETSYPGPGRFETRMKTIAEQVFLEGLPAGYTAHPYTMAAAVQLPDGRTIPSERYPAVPTSVPIAPGIARPGPNDFVRRELWPTLMFVPKDVFDSVRNQPGIYHGTLDYTIERHEELAVMPLRIGSAYADGPRSLLVTNLAYRLDRCMVTFRSSSVTLFSQWSSRPRLVPTFRNHGQMLRDALSNDGSLQMASISVGSLFFAGAPHLIDQLDIGSRVAEPLYPTYDEPRATGPRCDEIDIAFERTTYAGSLTRTLELRDFYLNDSRELPASPRP